MSGVPETASVMGNRDPFPNVSPAPPQNPSGASQSPMDQQMRMAYTEGYRSMGSSPPYNQMPGGTPAMNLSSGGTPAMNLSSADPKRKRGRPRKYGPDGSMSTLAMVPGHMQSFSPPAAGTPPLLQQMGGSASPTTKKARGRPPGSINKKRQLEAIGSNGIGFIPHVIDVNPGEDVSAKIMAFSQNGPRAVCILSANGVISNVALHQTSTSGATATYEGRFDILSLSGSFMLSDIGGQKSRTGGLTMTLAGPDGRVFGGCVAGLLIASSPVQVIVGSFIADGQKEPKSPNYTMDPLPTPSKMTVGGPTGASSSPSRGTFSESSGGPSSPLNLSSGACNNNHRSQPQGMSGMPWK